MGSYCNYKLVFICPPLENYPLLVLHLPKWVFNLRRMLAAGCVNIIYIKRQAYRPPFVFLITSQHIGLLTHTFQGSTLHIQVLVAVLQIEMPLQIRWHHALLDSNHPNKLKLKKESFKKWKLDHIIREECKSITWTYREKN